MGSLWIERGLTAIGDMVSTQDGRIYMACSELNQVAIATPRRVTSRQLPDGPSRNVLETKLSKALHAHV